MKYFLVFIVLTNISCTKTDNRHFVKISESNKDNIILDIRYATDNNFTKRKIYKKTSLYLPIEISEKLFLAAKYAKKIGYKIKIFDGFRSLDVQQKLFKDVSDERYVSDPEKGVASHTRGVAIDLTLVDVKTGKELDMGTEFDSFSEKAHHDHDAKITEEQTKNRLILAGIMNVSQFTAYKYEWWHYNYRLYEDYPNYDNKYPKLKSTDIGLDFEY
jgi:D-alanyl-D-alanine dipeptidase